MKKIVSLLIATCLVLTLFCEIDISAAQGNVGNPLIGQSIDKHPYDIKKYDVITFGNYFQSDFKRKEPIRWIVMRIENGIMYLISEKNLYPVENLCIEYEEGNPDPRGSIEDIISQEINDKFYKNAFSEKEQYDIVETEKSKNVLLPSFHELKDLMFILNIGTNYCGVDCSLVQGYKSGKKPGYGNKCYEIQASFDYIFNSLSYDKAVSALRPAIYLRKSSKLWKKAGVVGDNLWYLNPDKTHIKSIKAKKNRIKIKWDWQYNTNGYIIQCSKSKKFKNKKKLYIRARAFALVDGSKTYGAWSKPKKVKIKR